MTTHRWSRIICHAIFALGALTAIIALGAHPERGSATVTARGDAARGPLAVGQPFEIKIKSSAVAAVSSLPIEERRDQWRDWGIYGTVSRDPAAPDVAAKATYQMAPLRLPYLRDLYIFDYGWGRRVYVGDRALVFYDDATPDVTAVIGRLADQIRMETGHKPAHIELYALHIEQDYGRIGVVRKPDLADAELFGAAFGYVERDVTDAPGMSDLLAQIDDVSYVAIGDNHDMVIGGRRFRATPTKNVTAEDVAALYQAASQVARAGHATESQADAILSDVNAKYRIAQKRGDRSDATRQRYEREVHDRTAELASQQLTAPGFSLDPHWKLRQLAEHLGQLVADPCAALHRLIGPIVEEVRRDKDPSARSATSWAGAYLAFAMMLEKGDKACASISAGRGGQLAQVVAAVRAATDEDWEFKLAPYYKLVDELDHSKTPSDSLLSAALKYFEAADQVQCARYDGPHRDQPGSLQGTAVGMNLFYTDLAAKLYLLDYHHAAPVSQLSSLISGPKTPEYAIFAKENRERPSTRLWFGPRVDAVAKLSGDALAFRHIATRVYAAGSNPTEPGKEELPGEWARLNLSWWDRHYEAIADYEPQYHVQNQIMKWSVIAALMADHNVDFLASVPVARTYRFDKWAATNRATLRYQYDIPLHPEAESPTGTECMDVLRSYMFGGGRQLGGGVSLASENSLRALTPLAETEELGFRFRPTQELAGSAGTATRPWPTYAAEESTVAINAEKTATRFAGVNLQLGKQANVAVVTQVDELQFAVSGSRESVGQLAVRPLGDNAEIGWTAGEMEKARAAVTSMESTSTPSEVAAGDRSPILFDDSKRVVIPGGKTRSAIEVQPAKPGDEAADYLAAAATDENTQFHARSLAERALPQQLNDYDWQRLNVPKANADFNARAAVERQFSHAPPPAGGRPVVLRGEYGALEGQVAPDGSLWVGRPASEQARQAWQQLDIESNLTPAKLRSIAQSSETSFDIGARGVPKIAEALEAGDARTALLAMDPAVLEDSQATAQAVADATTSAEQTTAFRASVGRTRSSESLTHTLQRVMRSDSADLLADLHRDLKEEDVVAQVLSGSISGSTEDVEAAADQLHAVGSPELADVLEARAGQHTIEEDVLAALAPVSKDDQRGLAYRFPHDDAHVISGRDTIRAKIAQARHGDGSFAIYVDDRIQVSREGVEAGVEPKINQWIDDDKIRWEERPSLGTYPQAIEDPHGHYVRLPLGTSAPRHGGPILIVRPCTADRDSADRTQPPSGC